MKSLFTLIFLISGLAVFSQEICNNGIDDDGDKLIDCYDPDCACDNSFYISSMLPACQFSPVSSTFSLETAYTTENAVKMDARQNAVVGDIDGDGKNEIVAKNDEAAGQVYIFDGVTGAIEDTITAAPLINTFATSMAIADTDSDGYAEIYWVTSNSAAVAAQRRRVMSYEYNPGSGEYEAVMTGATNIGNNTKFDRSSPNLADFDQDGIAEVYVGNQIWSTSTGVELAAGPNTNAARRGGHNSGSSSSRFETFSAAADVLPTAFCADCAGLELVAGNEVYSVNIATGTMTVQVTISGKNDGPTSIADFDMDGDLDAIVNGRGTIYVWDIQTSSQIGSDYNIPGTSTGGILNVANFDSDAALEIGTAGLNIYVVVDNDMSLLWSKVTIDGSERTGSTLFDFEADGSSEVIYRDEDTLFIFNGANGTVLSKVACESGTRFDYPNVVDVNNDGQAEIVCACGGGNGNISVFKSSNQPWVRARSVWNQFAFYNTQVNDDLTINQEWQDPSLVANGILNSYLAQATYSTYNGLPLLAAPDAGVAINSVTGGTCSSTNEYQVQITVSNQSNGALKLPKGTPVSFYDGDPFMAGATYISTLNIPNDIAPDASEMLTETIVYAGGIFNLYALVNDNGGGSLPLTSPETNIGECDYLDNISIVEPVDCGTLPVELSQFFVEKMDKTVMLKWVTETEQHNKSFVIERSLNGYDFEKIGEVAGRGQSAEASFYQFSDRAPFQGVNYYRLKQIDFDGTISFSDVRVVDFIQSQEIILLNNPVRNNIHVSTVLPSRYTVYNSIGMVVSFGELEGNVIDVSFIAKGNYFVRFDTNGIIKVIPFVKQ